MRNEGESFHIKLFSRRTKHNDPLIPSQLKLIYKPILSDRSTTLINNTVSTSALTNFNKVTIVQSRDGHFKTHVNETQRRLYPPDRILLL